MEYQLCKGCSCPACCRLSALRQGLTDKIRALFWLMEEDRITLEQAVESIEADLFPVEKTMMECPHLTDVHEFL